MPMKKALAVPVFLGTVLLPGLALAQTCSATATPPVFANYSQNNPSPTTGVGNVSITCRAALALLLPYTVQLGPGTGGTLASRAMSRGSFRLLYQLYTGVTYTQIYGDSTGGTGTGSGTIVLQLGNVAITVQSNFYALIPAGQWSGPGLYTDNVQVTVIY